MVGGAVLHCENRTPPSDFTFRYTLRIVKRLAFTLLLVALAASLGFANETSFSHVRVPTPNGKHIKAVLTFSDKDKAIEVRPAKGDPVTIPYGQIDKCEYEYSIGLMDEKEYWLEVHYHEQNAPKVFVLLMAGHDYLQILDALKAHTGIDAEVLGNAKKR
jgi:hypothetical protein